MARSRRGWVDVGDCVVCGRECVVGVDADLRCFGCKLRPIATPRRGFWGWLLSLFRRGPRKLEPRAERLLRSSPDLLRIADLERVIRMLREQAAEQLRARDGGRHQSIRVGELNAPLCTCNGCVLARLREKLAREPRALPIPSDGVSRLG